ncbi:NACHT domain-containing NTPase [Rhizobium leguminosarum]|uniref:NACHT domain-containing protein n=1 Tax=Rhizobium leguminosarum TaxID=384 RepID=A0A7K3VE16_RHILE|nr:NACHT domain-containing protein [Rhizobium leguminosarum]NEK15042.1 NACHT domain-containing protein [Rhizobium leguminosarum]
MASNGITVQPQARRSTTAIGDELRDQVIDLLEAEGHRVSREVRVGTKKVDVLFEIEDEFRPQKIAIECKNLDKNLSQAELNLIWSDYSLLIEENEITSIFVITRLDFSPEAKQYANKRRGLEGFSLKEFEESLLGYRRYCREVGDLFSEGGLENYYVQPSVENGGKLHDRIVEWVRSEDTAPVAILGGYGMGKTSYCKFLTRTLADQYLDDPSARVPIYVRLSDIATQTDVDGLIAKTLADRYNTKNYSFAKFKKLNRSGKFVVIFDGFDEMKHALSWTDFKYNFSQIHSLLDGKAKIMVAGRPNAFLSDSEHAWILRGARLVGEQLMKVPDAPEYLELSLSQFSDDEVTSFLDRYLRQKLPTGISDPQEIERWISERVGDFEKIRANGDIYRPVHLKIYADIAADPNAKLESFSTYGLYSIATSRISEREGEKVVRKQIDSEKRQRIIERIAWWLWDTFDGRRLYFIAEAVPEYIIGRDLLDDQVFERDAIYREIFTGSFLERKFGENYYFSHRSFLEFFVAGRLEKAESHQITVQSVFKNINPEILVFLKQSPGYQDFLAYVYKGMQRFSGHIPLLFLEEIYTYRSETGAADAQTGIQLLLKYFGFLRSEDFDTAAYVRSVRTDLASTNQEHRETALYFALYVLRLRYDWEGLLALLQTLAASVSWPARAGTVAGMNMTRYTFSRSNIGEYVFVRFARIAAERSRDGKPVVTFDIARAYDEVKDKRPPKIDIEGNLQGLPELIQPRIEFAEVFGGIGLKEQKAALDVLSVGVA